MITLKMAANALKIKSTFMQTSLWASNSGMNRAFPGIGTYG